jgi:hypothetical protein
VNQPTAEAGQTEKRGPEFIAFGFDQGQAIEGGAVEGEQVVVVGFVAGVGDLAELFRSKRVDDADVEASRAEGALDGSVVASGALDDGNEIAELVIAHGLAEVGDGLFKRWARVFESAWAEEEVAEEVGQHPLGIAFVAIEASDAEVGGAGAFDAVVEITMGLVQDRVAPGGAGVLIAFSGHENSLRVKGGRAPS